jgi:orotate phosphoribosyltransferase
MDSYKREFIELMVEANVLTFGDFVTKSGRRSPYFMNAGRFNTGPLLARLGLYYAHAIHGRVGAAFDVLFGPAYKGIPIATAAAIALHQEYGKAAAVCFDRKEVKDHGEGGALMGHVPRDGDRVVIVEDVTTAGTSIREVVPRLRAAARVELKALVVAVDRQERGTGSKSALAEVGETYGLETFAIVTLDEIVAHLGAHDVGGRRVLDQELLARIGAYRAEFGA